MILNLKYFGLIAEAINKEEESFNFIGTSISDLEIVLKTNYSELKQLNYNLAVNQTIATKELILKENDEIALLPPFAGG